MKEAEIWNKRYAGSDAARRAAYDPWLDRWSSLLPPGGPALDIGCGLGLDTEFLLGKGYAVTAIDFSGEAVRLTRGRNPRADVRLLGIDELATLKPARFNLVLANLSLHYLTREGTERAFETIHQLLMADGLFAFRLNASDDRNYGSPENASSWDRIEVEGIRKQFFTEEKIRTMTVGRFEIVSLEKMTTGRYGKEKRLFEGLVRPRSEGSFKNQP